MKKFLSVFLLVTLAVFLASWSFSGQTTISRAPMAQAAKAKAASQNNEAAKQAELAKVKAEQPAPAIKADVVNNDEITKPKETEATDAKVVVEQPQKWQPVYGEKGEILNPQPSVNLLDAGGKPGNPSMVTATVFLENFNNWGPFGNNPPTGWSITDSGVCVATWDNNDWHKFYYSSWLDTVARVYYSPIQAQNEWLVTPAANFATATVCSLTCYLFYDDYTGAADTFFVLGSATGSTWTDTIAVYQGVDRGSSVKASSKLSLNITAFAQGDANYKVAFIYKGNNSMGAYIDDVNLWADGTNLITQNFNGWGPYGNNPPASWTILDYGDCTGYAWDNNDWHKFYNSTWLDTIARVYNTPTENQNEKLTTPSINLTPASDQVLLSFKHFYDDNTTDNTDTGYVLGSRDGGATWPYVLATYTADQGSLSTPVRPQIDITSWANNYSNVKIAFKYVGNADYGWYLDSVKVETIDLPDHDVSTVSLLAPSIIVQGYSTPVKTRVYNGGTTTETFPDSVKISSVVKNTIFFEEFSNPQSWTGANPPINPAGTWAILDSGKAGWSNYDWHAYYNTGWSDTVARVNYVSNDTAKSWLISPSINCVGRSNVHLTFNTYYWDAGPTSSDTAWIYGTDDNWATTRLLAMWNETHGSSTVPEKPDFDISTWAANKANVKIGFKYVGIGSAPWYWYVDEVKLYELGSPVQVYNQGQSVAGLTALETRDITFPNWSSPSVADYLITTFTALSTDSNRGNDTLKVARTGLAHTGTGGPDAGYYSWQDNINGGGAAYAWRDISGIGTPISFSLGTGDDRFTPGIALGFNYYFYGATRNRLFVSEDGIVSFDTLTSSFASNSTIPSTYAPNNIVAALWADLMAGTDASAYFYTNNVDTAIISFINFKWYAPADSANRFTAQIILTGANNKIKVQYQSVGPVIPTLHTIGIEGSGAIGQGLQYYYNGTPAGNLAMSGLAITYNYNPPAHDMAATAIVVPGTGAVNGVPFTPRAVFTNLGGLTETAVPVHFDIYDSLGTLRYNSTKSIASIAPTASDSVNFDAATLTINGTYRCTTYVSLGTDTYPANNKFTKTFLVDQHYGSGGPDADYYYWKDNTVAGGPTYSWIEINPTLGGPGSSLTPTQDSVFDDRAYVFPIGFAFTYYGQSYTEAYASTNGLVLFDSSARTAYSNVAIPTAATPNAFIAPYWDDLYLRTDAGARLDYYQGGTYTVIQWTGDAQTSTDSMFLTFEVILYNNGDILVQYKQVGGRTDYSGEGATIGIESHNLSVAGVTGLQYLLNGTPPLNMLTNNLAIKYYRNPPAHDVAASSYLVPNSTGLVGVPFTPQVIFTNNSTTAEPSVPVRLFITPGTYNNPQTASIPGSGRDTVSFASFTPTTGGIYNLTAVVQLGSDVNPVNDTVKMTFTAYDQIINFESGNGSLTGTGDWQWGAPTSGPNAAYSGTNCWATNLAGNYTTGTSYLDFKIQVGASGSATFGFAQWYYYESSYDGGNFKISTDNGLTWVLLYPAAGYTGFTNSYNPLYGTAGDSIFTGTTHQYWHNAVFDLTPYNGQIVMARLSSGADGSVFYPGWYVDDFAFANCSLFLPAHDVEVVSIDAPTNLAGGQTYSIIATIRNNGANTETFGVRAFDNHGYSNVQTITSLAPGASIVDTFPNWAVAACSTYALKVASQLGTDVNPSNDTVQANYVATPPYNSSIVFDNGVAYEGWTFIDSIDIMATRFDLPITGAISSIDYRFWPSTAHNPVQVYIFTDVDLDGLPDATPVLVDTILPSSGEWTSWSVGCIGNYSINCGSSFWAGFSVTDSLHMEYLTIDNLLDYPNNQWAKVAGIWQPDTFFTGDKLIRAHMNGDLNSVNIAVGTTAVFDTVDSHGQDTVTTTLDNTGTSCDLVYTVAVHQITPSLLGVNNQMPIGTNSYSNAKGKFEKPIYPSVTLGSGGPDAFGYRWKDSDETGGPVYSWVDISTIGTLVTFDSCSSSYGCYDEGYTYAGIPMGMSFGFYGTNYDTIFVSSNGWVSFLRQISAYLSNTTMPSTSLPNGLIAPMWSDLEGDSASGGSVRYYHDTANSRFIISWLKWAPYNVMADTFNMQVILNGDGSIVMQYGPGTYSNSLDYTVGIENADGTIGLQTAYNPATAYLRANMAIKYYRPFQWISTDLVAGSLSPAAPPVPINIFMNGSGLEDGTYTGAIVINSNDPDQPVTTINVTFKVGRGPACDYMLGDVNGNGNVIGSDVTYAVRYFKGLGAVPPDSCYDIRVATPSHWLYVGGDVNASCTFAGSDVTRLVSFFKGVSILQNCAYFPRPTILITPSPIPENPTLPVGSSSPIQTFDQKNGTTE